MAEKTTAKKPEDTITGEQLIKLLNEDLSREYQAIIAYVVYSQVLKGAAYMNIAAELAVHATQELSHALTIAKMVDYLGGMPTVTPLPSRRPKRPKTCSGSTSKMKTKQFATTATAYASAKRSENSPWPNISGISSSSSKSTRSDLATALGINVPDVTSPRNAVASLHDTTIRPCGSRQLVPPVQIQRSHRLNDSHAGLFTVTRTTPSHLGVYTCTSDHSSLSPASRVFPHPGRCFIHCTRPGQVDDLGQASSYRQQTVDL